MSSQLSSIYIIGPQDGPYKIGHSQDPSGRLSTLQTSRTDSLVLHYSLEGSLDVVPTIEKLIHRQLSHKRIRGEWFAVDLPEAIEEVQYAMIRWAEEPALAFRFKHKLL